MDANTIIILKGQIRSDLRKLRHNPDKRVYEAVFDNGKRYFYSEGNCVFLSAGEPLVGQVRITRKSDALVFHKVLGVIPGNQKYWLELAS